MYFGKPQTKKPNSGTTNKGSTVQYGAKDTGTNPYNGPVKHKVKSGETLGDLEIIYNVSKEEIIKANSGKNGVWGKRDRSRNWLYTSDVLIIPQKEKSDALKKKYNYTWQNNLNATVDNQLLTEQNSHAYNELSFQPHAYGGAPWMSIEGHVFSESELEDIQVYIFFIDDFTSQTTKVAKDQIAEHGLNHVAISELASIEAFKGQWARMSGSPSLVIINSHGKNQSMTVGHGESFGQLTATGNGKTNINGTKVSNVQDLEQPKADLSQAGLFLNTCHSNDTNPDAHGGVGHEQGALKGTKQTIAQVFASQFDFSFVRATKDSVGYVNLHNSGHTPFIDNSWERGDPYPEDDKWDFISKRRDGSLQTLTEEIP
ncbi:MAG: hypothetical protein GQ574_02675 [Crocinitomix sp.]|nr:hypothetical protein [Crocinitomix sp.]